MSAHSARRGPDLDEVGQSQNAFSVPRRSVAQGSRVKCVRPLPSSSFPDRCHTLASPPRLVGIASAGRSEGHTSELQSLMRISYAVFCLQKKKITNTHHPPLHHSA